MRVIICGGRNYWLRREDYAWLTDFLTSGPMDEWPREVITGGASGADYCAERWAKSRAIPVQVMKAEWTKYGIAAGPIRNTAMLDYMGDDGMVIAFPGNKGTHNMIRQAERRGVRVVRAPGRNND